MNKKNGTGVPTIAVNFTSSPVLRSYTRDSLIMAELYAVPGFTESAKVLGTADEMLADLLSRQSESGPVLDTDTMLESGEVPNGWLDSIRSEYTERQALAAQLEAVGTLRTEATARLDYIATDSTDDVLSGLGRQMDEVVSAVSVAVSGLDGAATAAEAIDRGKAAEWAVLADHTKRYEALRSAQAKVMITSHGDLWQQARAGRSNDPTASYATLRNFDEMHQRFGYSDGLPWPAGTAEFLAWTARNGAVVWLPTTEDLSALVSERAAYFRDETEHYAYLDRSALVGAVNSGAVHPHIQLRLQERGLI